MGFQNAGRAAPEQTGNGSLDDAHSLAACCNHPNSPTQATAQAEYVAKLRRQRLVERVHRLGSAPLFHLLAELDAGKPVWPTVERYAALPADFIRDNGGDRFAHPLHCIDGSGA